MSILFIVVPVVLAAAGLWMLIGAVRGWMVVRSLERSDARATGTVVAAHVHHSSHGSSGNRTVSSRMEETIEFRAPGAGVVRGTPVYSDIGMLDRSGTEVRVIYTPDNPSRFIAPKDERFKVGQFFFRIVFAVVFLSIVVFFIIMSQRMLGQFPFGVP